MKIVNGMVEFEQCEFPGSIGDSLAETTRLDNLHYKLGLQSPCKIWNFLTGDGFGIIRHPNAPFKNQLLPNGERCKDSWREVDTPNDQVTPFLLTARNRHEEILVKQIKLRISQNYFRMGNGDFIQPGPLALYKEWQWLLDFSVGTQASLFNLPVRWGDAKNQFEPNENSSADYLNHFHMALECPEHVRRKISMDRMLDKIFSYYASEPNSKLVTELYHMVALKLW